MRNEKELRQEVYEVVKSAGLLNGTTLERVLETGQIFTKAHSISELDEVLEDIDGLSRIGERFSGFMNGILFNIEPIYEQNVFPFETIENCK